MVSIIIATYNRAKFIDITLESILDQTYINYEVIIVDDGGEDNTKEVLAPYLRDPRFKYYKRPLTFSKGCPGSRNFGLTKAQGEFIWFFDDDDIAHPALLGNCITGLFNANHDFCRFKRTVFYDFERISFDETSKPEIDLVSKKNLKQMIIGKLPFNSCQVIWRRESLGNQIFRGDIVYSDDWEFYSRLLASGLKGVTLDKTLLYARKHPGSATQRLKLGNKKILNSVILANFSVIDLVMQENIMDRQLFQFFYRKGLFYNSYPIVKYLIEKSDLNYLDKIKYKLGFHLYPVLRPIFNLKSKLLRP